MPDIDQRPQVVLVHRCFIINQDKHILFIQRANQLSYGPGLWEVPGGKVDQGQDLAQALERELMEETNLQVKPISNLVFADSFTIQGTKYDGWLYLGIYSLGQLTGGQIQLSHEHQRYQWLTYDQALELDLTKESRKALINLGHQLTSNQT